MACTATVLRLPQLGRAARTSAQVGSAQTVELALAHPQLRTRLSRRELPGALEFEQMTHEVRRMTMG